MWHDFLWWFDDLAWWKKSLFIIKFCAAIIAGWIVIFYDPPVESDGYNQFYIAQTNYWMSRDDYREKAEAHCQSFGLTVVKYESRNPYGRVNTRRFSSIHHFFTCGKASD